jgi:hypothetical protein
MSNDSRSISSGNLRPPFFIMGPPRSGTTLVEQLLSNHSRIAVYHESAYYPIFRPVLHRYGDLRQSSNLIRLIADFRLAIRAQRVNPPEIEEFRRALVAPTFEGVLATFLHLYAQGQGKVRGGDKTPEHYAYLAEILETFPESPIIFLIRDPRDTVLSMRKALGTSIANATRIWNEAFLSYSRASRPVHLVRYEELAHKPLEVIQATCAFLGERYEPRMLRFFERVPEHVRDWPFHSRLLGPVASASVGGFRQMSTLEIERIEAACRAGMEAMGYPFAAHREVVEGMAPARSHLLKLLSDRLRYYRWKPWRRPLVRWRVAIRVRARYWLTLGPWRDQR